MDYGEAAGPSRRQARARDPARNLQGTSNVDPAGGGGFDIFEWYPHFQSCLRYFLDHAQHGAPVQALSRLMNILLPHQKQAYPITSYTSAPSPSASAGGLPPPPPPRGGGLAAPSTGQAASVSLIPYIRRLVATANDTPAVLHGFFGDDWREGIGNLHEAERRNYLFAAKSMGWAKVKNAYDMGPDETCPYLRPLTDASETEIVAAERAWSEWLAMQDWMVGPRAPEVLGREARVKREPTD